jgi:hypothetical protein
LMLHCFPLTNIFLYLPTETHLYLWSSTKNMSDIKGGMVFNVSSTLY